MKTEIAFWDTSAIVPLCVLQDTTIAAQKRHREFPSKILWWGSVVEVRSSFARLSRTGELEDRNYDKAVLKWSSISIRGRDVPPSQNLLDIAIELPAKWGLRSLDAFQLAAALVWCNEKPRNRPFVCADKRLGEAASDAGFDVVSLI